MTRPFIFSLNDAIQLGEIHYEPEVFLCLVGSPYSAIANAVFPDATPTGTVSVLEFKGFGTVLNENDEASLNVKRNSHRLHITKLFYGSHEKLLIGCMDHPLPAEQAVAWSKAVLGTIQPKRVVVVSYILAMNYRGLGDSSSEDLVFRLDTSLGMSPISTPVIPASTVLSGVSAALLQMCELGGKSHKNIDITPRPARLITAVEHSQVPPASLVITAAQAVLKTLKDCIQVPDLSLTDEVRKAISQAVDTAYRASAENSIFI